MTTMGQRFEHFDILKGVGIILVVLGHVTRNKELSDFIYAFHMPLFFIVAGYFLHNKKYFIQKQAEHLLIPYFSFGLLSFLYWWMLELPFRDALEGVSVSSQFLNLFIPHTSQACNVVLWFLPCLFSASIIANYINVCIKSIVIKCIIILLLVSFVGFLKSDIPFLIGKVAQALPFLLIGSLASIIPIRYVTNFQMLKMGGGNFNICNFNDCMDYRSNW